MKELKEQREWLCQETVCYIYIARKRAQVLIWLSYKVESYKFIIGESD